MKKYAYPPFVTMLATIIAVIIHKITGFDVNIDMAAGSIMVVGNYLIMQFASDIQKIRRGELPTGNYNSMKLVTAAIICIVLGVSNYFQLDYSLEEIIVIVGMGMALITGKGIKDIFSQKVASETVVQTDSAPSTPQPMAKAVSLPQTYEELVPVMKFVHESLNQLHADVKTGKSTDDTKAKISTYLKLQDVFKGA